MCFGGGGTPREVIFMKSYCLDRSSMAKLNFNHTNAEQILKRPPSPILSGFFFFWLVIFFRKVGPLPPGENSSIRACLIYA